MDVTGRGLHSMDTDSLQTDSVSGRLQTDSINFSKPTTNSNSFIQDEEPTTSRGKPNSMTRTEPQVSRKAPEKNTETITRILSVLLASVYRYHDFEVKDRLQKLCDFIEKITPDVEYDVGHVVELLNRLEDEPFEQVIDSIRKSDQMDAVTTESNNADTLQSLMNVGTDGSSSRNKNKDLKPELTCKVCLDNPVAVTFVPCGHLVTCQSCTSALFECPVCRAQIRGTIRTYL